MSCVAPCYVQTAAEMAASVMPVVFSLAPGNVKRYGAVGDGTTPDDAAINDAINQAIQPSGSAVYFPKSDNEYAISTTINITGSVYIYGECDRLSFVGPRIVQRGTGNLFAVTGGTALSLAFENISFCFGASSPGAGIASVYVNPSSALNTSSFYFKNCWFQNPGYYALNISNCDDVQVLACTFDVSSNLSWLGLGLNGLVKHVSVVGCTFFNEFTTTGQIDLGTIDGFVFEANRVYWDGTTVTPYVINALTGAVAISSLVIQGNIFEGSKIIAQIGSTVTSAVIANNVATSVNGAPAIIFGGSGSVSSIFVTGNIFSGIAGTGKGLIDATGTNVSNCVVCNNIILGGSDYAINFNSTTSNNRIASNITSGWAVKSINTPSYASNGITESGTCTLTLTGVSNSTAPTGTGKYTVNGNSVTLTLPVISGASNTSSATLTGLPSFLNPGSVQSFLITVTNAGANVLGVVSIGTGGILSLYADAAYAGFSASGLKGIQACAITFQLG